MDTRRILMDLTFSAESASTSFSVHCRSKYQISLGVNGGTVYLVLRKSDDKASVLSEADNLGGSLLAETELNMRSRPVQTPNSK